jgi:hypothetical protein
MAIVNINCWNDADFFRGFLYQTLNPDGSTGPPFDLTGNTMKMGIRFSASDVNEQLELTTENGGIEITSATGGTFNVIIMQAQLVQMPTGDYEHSLIRITSGNKFRIWSGSLTINPGASR